MDHSIAVAVLFLVTPLYVLSQDAVGCGGFIKLDKINDNSPTPKIAYNRLSIQLTLPDGTLKYVTEVLPNGAYSMPIYDHGEYILRVDAPEGWGFEPVEGHRVQIESRDSCKEDYNFRFLGYTIFGQMITKGLAEGPVNYLVDLLPENTKQAISTVRTDAAGKFRFSNVPSGIYLVKEASGQPTQVRFETSEVKVNVNKDNTNLPKPLVIKGFAFSGLVTSEDEPIKGVHFLLFSDKVTAKDIDKKAAGCLPDKESRNNLGVNHPLRSSTPICETVSDETGAFNFGLLPGGSYTIAPFYKSETLVFDVEPSTFPFKIVDGDVDVGKSFRVAGFSVSGRVVRKIGDKKGLENAEVLINGNPVTKTDSEGRYHLDSMKPGHYSIDVRVPQLEFSTLKIHLTPNNPTLRDIPVTKFACCGRVEVDKSPSQSTTSSGRPIVVLSRATKEEVTRVYTEGPGSEFCVLLAPGSYVIRPEVTQAEETSLGLRLAPADIKVDVVDAVISDLTFSQFRAVVKGQVRCLDACPTGQLEVTLTPDGETGAQPVTQHIKVDKTAPGVAHFQFTEVIPGHYKVALHTVSSIADTNWCWKADSLDLHITSANVSSLLLEQTGFGLQIATQHHLKVTYTQKLPDTPPVAADKKKAKTPPPSKPEIKGEWNIEIGTQKVCLPHPGDYVLKAVSCHRLEQSEFTLSTSSVLPGQLSTPLTIVAQEHQVRVALIADSDTATRVGGDIRVEIAPAGEEGAEPAAPVAKKTLKLSAKSTTGEVDFWVRPDHPMRVSVFSSVALISPASQIISTRGEECSPLVAEFKLELGVFIQGTITPPIPDVSVVITSETKDADSESSSPEEVATLLTDAKGAFKLGPLPRHKIYSVTVSRPGYSFDRDTSTPASKDLAIDLWNYKANKLAEVIVTAIDTNNGKPLQGVLLSVVGDNYRGNELTNAEGNHVFLDLSPGNYYVRALMKEYEFSPAGAQEIKVKEGGSVELKMKGVRSAYSAMGQVVSLTGDAESGVVVEARELGATADATAAQRARCNVATKEGKTRAEQATTDDNGKFRIRGLWPGCRYEIALKLDSPGVGQLIERSVPDNFPIKMSANDVDGFQFYAFRRMNMMEVSASVMTSNDNYLNSLSLTVFPAAHPDHILTKHNFATDSLLFTINSLLPSFAQDPSSSNGESRSYVIRLESRLSSLLYSNISAQEVSFTLGGENGSHPAPLNHHFIFEFNPVPKIVPDHDQALNTASLITLPTLLALLALLYINRDRCVPQAAFWVDSGRRLIHEMFSPSITSAATSSGKHSNDVDMSGLSDLNHFVAKTPSQSAPAPPPVHNTKKLWVRSRKT